MPSGSKFEALFLHCLHSSGSLSGQTISLASFPIALGTHIFKQRNGFCVYICIICNCLCLVSHVGAGTKIISFYSQPSFCATYKYA